MNLKGKTAAEPRLSRVIQGPSNITTPSVELDDTNGEQFVTDWGLFSQTLLWIIQNGRDPACVNAAIDAIKHSELLNLQIKDD